MSKRRDKILNPQDRILSRYKRERGREGSESTAATSCVKLRVARALSGNFSKLQHC